MRRIRERSVFMRLRVGGCGLVGCHSPQSVAGEIPETVCHRDPLLTAKRPFTPLLVRQTTAVELMNHGHGRGMSHVYVSRLLKSSISIWFPAIRARGSSPSRFTNAASAALEGRVTRLRFMLGEASHEAEVVGSNSHLLDREDEPSEPSVARPPPREYPRTFKHRHEVLSNLPRPTAGRSDSVAEETVP